MDCTTGKDVCVFLSKGSRECKFSIVCTPIVEDCETANLGNPCSKILLNGEEKFCSAYQDPKIKWTGKRCPLRQERKVEDEKKTMINPLKASKKAAKGGAK
jgi:hypothetical protein